MGAHEPKTIVASAAIKIVFMKMIYENAEQDATPHAGDFKEL